MKKLLLLLILCQQYIYSQVYISPNTYVFADNISVFIKQDLELNAATSNFYLRNDSQLLQGTTVAGANRWVGNLTI